MAINRVIISGNLTRDAELKRSAGGNAVLAFTVAVNERRKNPQTGEYEDYPNFVSCNMFGRRAEAVAQYLLKGTKVSLEGRLHYHSWQDKSTGEKRSVIGVNVDELEFMSRNQTAKAVTDTFAGAQLYEETEIPF